MKTKYKFIEFRVGEKGAFRCENRRYGDLLGIVEYRDAWNDFVFIPQTCSMFSPDCLADIQHFMGQLKKGK